ncbi:MAG: hypothetical protein ING19_20670 [Azospirillum sp.]|nr:hypothetical protein [Azospirillum sp.]
MSEIALRKVISPFGTVRRRKTAASECTKDPASKSLALTDSPASSMWRLLSDIAIRLYAAADVSAADAPDGATDRNAATAIAATAAANLPFPVGFASTTKSEAKTSFK